MARAPIIFDLDDTLIESFPTYVRLHRRVAGELGWRVPSREELTVYQDSWEATLQGLWPDRSIAAFVGRYDELADRHPYPAVPGAPEAIADLRARGHRLFVVTKRSQRRLAQRMEEAGLWAEHFDGIYPREHQPAAKPSPRCFEPVWAVLGGVRSDAVYVGDRDEDHRAASGAGLRFLGVRTGPESALGRPPGTEHVETAADVPAWLDANGL